MITQFRADAVIPGDVFDTQCGVGDLAHAVVLKVRAIENDNPSAQDRIEFTLSGYGITSTRVLLASSLVRIIT